MILLSALVVGMNSIVSGTLRKSSAVRNAAHADFAAESALELGKAIVLGNITLPTLDENRVKFDGTPIACELAPEFRTILKITDVAGLVDLRFSSDLVLSTLLRGTTSTIASNAMLKNIRTKAASGAYVAAIDVLIAAGLPPLEAAKAAEFSTIHGRGFRLARDVTPSALAAMVSVGGTAANGVFGASPTNKVFKLEVETKTPGKMLVQSNALISYEPSGRSHFRIQFEKRSSRRLPATVRLPVHVNAPNDTSILCSAA